jgi:hypothetical protein
MSKSISYGEAKTQIYSLKRRKAHHYRWGFRFEFGDKQGILHRNIHVVKRLYLNVALG